MKKRISAVAASVMLMLFASFAVACSKETPSGDPDEPIVIKYSVTFAYNYDAAPNGGIYKTDTVVSGNTVAKPTDPTRDGFAFTAWTVAAAESSAQFDFTTAISADTTVYAQWRSTGGTTDPTDPTDPEEPPVTQKELTGIEIKTLPIKLTYTVGDTFYMTGLAVNAVYDNGDKEVITADDYNVSSPDMSTSGTVTVTVTYKADVSKTATFEITVNDRQVDPLPQKELTGIEIKTLPTKLTYTVGDTFDVTGLAVNAVYDNGDKEVITADEYDVSSPDMSRRGTVTVTVTYKADVSKTATFDITVNEPQQELPKHTINFDINGGDKSVFPIFDIEYGTTVGNVPVTSKFGYTFDGWYYNDVLFDLENTPITQDYLLVAHFTPVNYVLACGTGEHGSVQTSDIRFTVENYGGITLPEVTVTTEGYYFIGWFDAATGENEVTGITEAMVRAIGADNTLTVYARYSNEYTVEFDTNGGSAVPSQTVAYNSLLQKPTTALGGKVFLGWYTDAAFATAWDFAVDKVTRNITLYARWGETAGNGVYLIGSMMDWDLLGLDTVTQARYKLTETINGEQKTYTIANVTLEKDSEFKFVGVDFDKAEGQIDWDSMSVFNGLIGGGNAEISPERLGLESASTNIKVTRSVENATWTIVFGTDKYGNDFARITLDGYNEMRDPINDGNTVDATEKLDLGVAYLSGNFTNNYNFSDAWSTKSELITGLKYGNTYYFTKVYLKKYDAFKAVYKHGGGIKWIGGVYNANDGTVAIGESNIYLDAIEDGYYDIVFTVNGSEHALSVRPTLGGKLTIGIKNDIKVGNVPDEESFAVTVGLSSMDYILVDPIAAVSGKNTVTIICGDTVVKDFVYTAVEAVDIEATLCDVPEYKIGDTLTKTGITVNVVYSNGKTAPVPESDFTLGNADMTTAGEKVVTVTYSGMTETVNIYVRALKVTFDCDNGRLFEQSVNTYGQPTAVPVAPEKEHYTFAHWTLNGAEYNFAQGVTDDITLKAVWTVNSYTVLFDTDGGEPRPDAQTVEYMSSASKPTIDPTKSGLNFVSWTLDGEPYDFASPVKGDITLMAQWTDKSKYTVKFLNGNSVLREISVEEGSKIASFVPELKGYDFGGWYKDSALLTAFDFDEPVSSNTNIFAKLTETEYTITYILNDGINDAANPDKYTVTDGTVTLKDATKYGFEFVGWFTAGEGGDKKSTLSIDDFADGNAINLYARFAVKRLTVTFDLNYDGALENPAVTVDFDTAVAQNDIPAVARANYEFKGWYTDKACTDGKEWNSASKITESTTVYAKWEEKVYAENGVYIDDVRVKDCKENDGNTTEVMAEFIVVHVGQTVTFRYKNEWINITALSPDHTDGTNSKNFEVSDGGLTATATGGYSFYIKKDGSGVWIVDEEGYVECAVTDGDGIYLKDGTEPIVPFTFNPGNMNEISVTGVKVGVFDEDTEYFVKLVYGGEDITVTQLDHAKDVTVSNDGIYIKLYAGVYNFYYCYGKTGDGNPAGRLWIEGTQTGTAPAVDDRVAVESGVGNNGYSDIQKIYLVGMFGSMTDIDETKGYFMDCTGYNGENNYQCSLTVDLKEGNLVAILIPGWSYKIPYSALEDVTNFEEDTVSGYYKVKSDGTYTFHYKHYYGSTGSKEHSVYIAKEGGAITDPDQNIVLEPNSAAFRFNDALIVLKIDLPTWGISSPKAHIWKGEGTDLTGGWNNRKDLDGKSTYVVDSDITDGVKLILTFVQTSGEKQSVAIDCTDMKDNKQYTLTAEKITNWSGNAFDLASPLDESDIVFA